ncbi:MAG TPA: hypothetical protein VG960_14330 [Caulobacteraceae bacterium]|nr:hypothetical protein [Caulobacteraceae bacterium]
MSAHLPGVLKTIAEVAGEAAALQLAREAGGQEMKFSGRPGSALARIVGDVAAAKIAAELGGEKRTIPMANLRGAGGRRAAAAGLMANGKSAAAAALLTDMHERTARRARRKVQISKLPLFED